VVSEGNGVMRDGLVDVMALVRDQMRELSEVQRRRGALVGQGSAAEGLVEVSVDAQGVVTGVVIDESYLAEFELAELGGHVTAAARAAAQDVHRRAAAMMEPVSERRKAISALSDIVADAPDFSDAMAVLQSATLSTEDEDARDDGDDFEADFPRVRTDS
jgi:DNA-binding protein YbaB